MNEALLRFIKRVEARGYTPYDAAIYVAERLEREADMYEVFNFRPPTHGGLSVSDRLRLQAQAVYAYAESLQS